MAKTYIVLHSRIDQFEKGAILTEDQLPKGDDLARLLKLEAIKAYTPSDDSAAAVASDTPDPSAADSGDVKKLTDDELRAKATDLGLPAEQVAAFKRGDLIAAINQVQSANGSVPAAA